MRHHILSIGISKYQEASISNLLYASKDASMFYNLLTTNIGNIGYKRILTDSEATFSRIRAALGSDLQNELQEGDAFFLFYSGHGTTAVDSDGNNSTFIVPFDATRDITNTGISVSYLTDIFSNLKSTANVIIIDSCFSGSVDLTKGFNIVNTKSLTSLKSFNEVAGQGTLIFTASKNDEEAIEDPEYQNGLFTKFLLDELQIDREKDQHPVLDIFTPISEKVIKRAQKTYNHSQTPTMNGSIQGGLYLPNFKQPINITPEIDEPPRYPELSNAAYQIAEIEITNDDFDQLLKNTTNFILKNRQFINQYPKSGNEKLLENHIVTILSKLNDEWNNIFSEPISDINDIPLAISRLEGVSFQFIFLGCVIAKFGSDIQCNIYSSQAVEIFKMIENKQGIEPLIKAPEVIILEVIYYIGVICVINMNLDPLKILLETDIWDFDRGKSPARLISRDEIHYSKALGGYSTKVNDHIRDSIVKSNWLTKIEPRIIDHEINTQLQVNFLIVMKTLGQDNIWPDFARFYANRIIPLLNKIKFNPEFGEQVSSFLEVKKENLIDEIGSRIERLEKRGLDQHRWQSVTSDYFKE